LWSDAAIGRDIKYYEARKALSGTACDPLSKIRSALAWELWASVAEVDAGFFAGLFSAGSAYWSDADQGGKFDWVVKALPIGAKGC
jgi:hypothetical protein